MFAKIKALILFAIVYATGTIAMETSEIAAIFKTYDTEEDEEPDCQPDYVDQFLCPKDEELPCASIGEIEKYCISILGSTIATESSTAEKRKGTNALAGCVKYVGFHVVDEDHLACCQSSHCEDWLEDMFDKMSNYYDDDDDDDYYDEEDEL